MRNLAQHPLTEQEIIACLAGLESESRGGQRLGDMRQGNSKNADM